MTTFEVVHSVRGSGVGFCETVLFYFQPPTQTKFLVYLKQIFWLKGKLFYCQKAIKKVLFCQKIVRFDAYFLTEKIPSKKGVQTCANLTFADCTFADGHLLPRHSD